MSRISALYEAYLRKAPRQSRSRSVVEAILGGAAELLHKERSEERISVQEIADRAGVAIGSLYDYFRDRRSLLAALMAKATEDNRDAFDEVLDATGELSMEDAIRSIVDFSFATFASDKHVKRVLLNVAHAVGMMPTLAQATNVAVESLANALRKRTDVRVADPDLAAWTLTHTLMGAVHTAIWEDEPKCSTEALREELVTVYCRYLRGDPPLK
jgi:AcrR family transcriptional regulator